MVESQKMTSGMGPAWLSVAKSTCSSLVNDIFTCHLCRYAGTSREEFDRHMTDNHYVYKCPECNYSSRTQGRLRRHLKDVHAQAQAPTVVTRVGSNNKRSRRLKMIGCKYCEYVTTNKDEFWQHLEHHIPVEKQLRCPRCLFVTDLKHHYEYHIRSHSGVKPFRCHRCGYSCVNKSMLNSHLKCHSNVYRFRCATCSFAAKYSHALKLHMMKYRHSAGPVLNKDGSLTLIPSPDGPRESGRASPPDWTSDGYQESVEPVEIPHVVNGSSWYSYKGLDRLREFGVDETRAEDRRPRNKSMVKDIEDRSEYWMGHWKMNFQPKGLNHGSQSTPLNVDLNRPPRKKIRNSTQSTDQSSDENSYEAANIMERNSRHVPHPEACMEYDRLTRTSEFSTPRMVPLPDVPFEADVVELDSPAMPTDYQHEGAYSNSSASFTENGSYFQSSSDKSFSIELFEPEEDNFSSGPLDLTKRKKESIFEQRSAKEIGQNDNFDFRNSIRIRSPSMNCSKFGSIRGAMLETTVTKNSESLNHGSSTSFEANGRKVDFTNSPDHHQAYSTSGLKSPLSCIQNQYNTDTRKQI